MECKYEGCEGEVKAKGVCQRHYRRGLRARTAEKAELGDMDAPNSNHPLYPSYYHMMSSCNKPDYPGYRDDGLKVCGRWSSFDRFIEDMGLRPTQSHKLHRLDDSKGFTPGNCCWVDQYGAVEQGGAVMVPEVKWKVMRGGEVVGIYNNKVEARAAMESFL